MGSTAGKGKVPRVSRAGALGRDKKNEFAAHERK